mmetsp:Transcript_9568/g.17232  ORF Transcript_9568/g.17232 Transcript_9568/m.17232 type:complete len:142 (-) Transcript_9568:47-472(-)
MASSIRLFGVGFYRPAAYRGLVNLCVDRQMTNAMMHKHSLFTSAPRFDEENESTGSPSEGASVSERVLSVVSKFDKVEKDKVGENAHFVDDLGLDSLDTVELVMNFEDEFKIEIPDADADKIMSVSDAITYISGRPEVSSS